jgi:hypothetical protein
MSIKLEGHIAQLKQRHSALDKKIKEGHTDYLSDKGLQKMKFEKASIKRELERLKNEA